MTCGPGGVGDPLGSSLGAWMPACSFTFLSTRFWLPPEIHFSVRWTFGLPWMEQSPHDSSEDPSPPPSVSLGPVGTSQHHSPSAFPAPAQD